MQVRFLGIDISTNGRLSLGDIMNDLAYVSDTHNRFKITSHNRLAIINTEHNADFYLGIVISIKDNRKFTTLKKGAFADVIKLNELEKDESLIDVNYIAINKLTGKGIYAYYHNSLNINGLRNIIEKVYSRLKISWVEEYMSVNNVEEKKAKDEFGNGGFSVTQIINTDDLDEYLDKLKYVNEFKYDVISNQANFDSLGGLQSSMKKATVAIKFEAKTTASSFKIFKSILKQKGTGLGNGMLKGKDANDDERKFSFLENMEVLAEYDYDKIVEMVSSLDTNSFHTSSLYNLLISSYQKNKAILGVT